MRIPFILSVCLMACACRYQPLDNPPSQHIVPVPSTPKTIAIPDQKLGIGEIYLGQTRPSSNGKIFYFRSRILVTGKLVDFHPNGQKRYSKSMVDGLKEGATTHWDEAGGKTHTATYQAGVLHGSWMEYYPNTGQNRQEQIYQNGVETMRRGWWPNGIKRFEAEFTGGLMKSRALWDETGKPVEKSEYQIPTVEKPIQPKP